MEIKVVEYRIDFKKYPATREFIKNFSFDFLYQVGEKRFLAKNYGLARTTRVLFVWEDSGKEFYRLEKGREFAAEYFDGKKEKELKNDQNNFVDFIANWLEDEDFIWFAEKFLEKKNAYWLKIMVRKVKIPKEFLELYVSFCKKWFLD